MPPRRALIALFTILSPLCAADLFLKGRVLDETNTAVAGAHVVVQAPAMTPQEAITDITGAFTVRLPAPGSYTIRAESAGFFALTPRALTVDAAPGAVELTLNHQRTTSTALEVSAASSPVDLEGTTAERRLSGRQILEVPYPSTRSLRNALTLMPGVLQDPSGELHFQGGREDQVFYTLDGFNIGDPITGRFNTRLSVEAVRSVDFTTGRYSPEFGKGSAGALGIRTEAGDDQWRYSATNFIPGVDTRKGWHVGTWAPRANLSGPLRRGRAWFSDNLEGEYSQLVIEDLPRGQDRTTSQRISNLMHTQVNLTPANILYADFLLNRESSPRTGLGALDPISTTLDRRSRQYFFSLKDQLYLSRGLLLEIGVAHNRTTNIQVPQGNELYEMTPTGRRGNYFFGDHQHSRREQFLANLFLPAFELYGRHQLKAGTDLDRLHFRQEAKRTGYENFGLNGTLLSRTTFAGPGLFYRTNSEVSSYLTDAWQLRPNLLLEYGLRQDWDALVRQVLLSPRVAVAYAPHRWPHTRLAGGYAVIYDATSLTLFSRPLDQVSVTTTFDPNGFPVAAPLVTSFLIPSRSLHAPRYQNWSAGLQQQLPYRMQLTVNLLRRRGEQGFTYASAPTDAASRALYQLTNLRRDVYDSAEFTLHQSFGREYEWMTSYTRSRALSNSVLDFSVDQPYRALANVGRLGWDSPNRFLSWGYLPTFRPLWAMAYLLETRDGFPYSIARDTGQIVGPVNSSRYPTYFNLNLHLEREFHYRTYRFAVRGGYNNITNHRNPNTVNNILGSPDFGRYYGTESRHLVFRLRWLGREGTRRS